MAEAVAARMAVPEVVVVVAETVLHSEEHHTQTVVGHRQESRIRAV